MTILDGGRVVNSNGYIGYDTSFAALGTGTVTVSGSNPISGESSTWINNGDLTVGARSQGTLQIDANGLVRADRVYVGNFSSTVGTVELLGDAITGRGVLETSMVIGGNGIPNLVLNGGILRATTENVSFLNGFTSLAVGDNGAWFDTNGHTIVVGTTFTSGALSSFNKIGSGTLRLTGNSAGFGGTTYINAGTLQLEGTSGFIAGNVVNDGTFAFNRSNALTISGVISGTGSVRQQGSGTTTLAGSNSYSGGTELLGGVLSVSSDANLGDISGALTFNGGTLQVTGTGFTSTARNIVWGAAGGGFDIADVNNSFTVTQNLTGGGSLTKTGAGWLWLNGANSYSGGTTLSQGNLATGVSGGFGTGPVAINGTVGSYTNLYFWNTASAESLAISLANLGSYLSFTDNASAGDATIDNKGYVAFSDDSSAGRARITNGGVVRVYNNATLGSAVITNNATGRIDFNDNSTADGATLINNAGGTVDITGLSSSGIGIGSLSGSGAVNLGAKTLTLGALGTNDTIGGTIQDGGSHGGVGGSLIKTGAGTLTLSGVNTYTGGTTIAGGRLAVTDDSNLGNAAGGITFNGGTLQTSTPVGVPNFVTNRAITLLAGGGTIETPRLTFLEGDISGAGGLTKTGILPLVLDGTNTYLGPTKVNEGTLSPGSAGGFSTSSAFTVATGANIELRGIDASIGSLAGTGAVTNNNAIAAVLTTGSDNTSTTFSGTMSDSFIGPLSLVKVGSGTQMLSGANTYTGATNVNGGRLSVNGSIASSSLTTVNMGGTLGGIGTVGTTTIASGGTIAPGNSIGTLTVKGDITFAAGSTFEAEINPALDSDLIDASGIATITGGTVHAVKAGGVYTPGSRWTIIGADGGVIGTFDTFDQNMPFVDLALAYDANNVYIDATRNAVAFCDVARTDNQCATGDGLETTGIGNPVYDAVAAIADEDSARQALDALSGEIHASVKSALIEDSHFVRDAIDDRLRTAFEGVGTPATPVFAYGEGGPVLAPATTDRFAAWGQAFGSWGSFDANGNAASLDTSTGGFLTGMDGLVSENLRLGLLAGYSHTNFNADDRASSGDSDNYHLGVYGGTQMGALGLRAGVAYTWHDISTSRSVAFPGLAEGLSADYDAGTFQAFGEAGYRIDTATASFEPFANLAYVNLHTDAFAETGGAAALSSPSQTTDTTFTTLGLRASTGFDLGGMKTTARGMIGWRHAFGDTTQFATHAFGGGDAFTVAGVPIAKDAAVLEAGLDFDVSQNATLGISYTGQFASHARNNGAKADLRVRF